MEIQKNVWIFKLVFTYICFGDRISSGSTTRFYPELLNAAPTGEGSDFEEP